MALLTAQEIESADDLLYEDVPCPEWGGMVRVVVLTGEELDAYRADLKREKDDYYKRGFCDEMVDREVLLLHVCRDESRNRVFTEREQIAKLKKKSWMALERLYNAANKINSWTEEALEETRKNSQTGESGGTDTPITST